MSNYLILAAFFVLWMAYNSFRNLGRKRFWVVSTWTHIIWGALTFYVWVEVYTLALFISLMLSIVFAVTSIFWWQYYRNTIIIDETLESKHNV